jgi:glycerol-3-phosphate dehydrogenase (NAD(P)+)
MPEPSRSDADPAATIAHVGVVGAGAWGTALALTLANAGRCVTLWAHEPETVSEIASAQTNSVFLPGVPLPASIRATTDLAAIAATDAILLVPPAQHVRRIATALASRVVAGRPVVLCSKGLEQATGKRMGEVLAEAMPGATPAVLSGPSFAADVARGLPTALTLACADEALGSVLANALGSRTFRLYWSSDLVGVEIGGAVKNVLAIAAGIVDGRQLGASAHAALVTRGFAELTRLARAVGARPETLMGLSGLGDLLLTCGSPQSRNMSLGRALGQGRPMQAILSERRSVAEGVFTAAAVSRLARERGVEMPIVDAVAAIVAGDMAVDSAIDSLLSRPFKPEI